MTTPSRRRFPKPATLIERWWLRVEKSEDPDGCWEWTGAKWPRGYGKFTLPGTQKRVPAHRWGYEALVAPVAAGLHMDHLCRNTSCVNPAHLEPVTCSENVRRGVLAEVTRAKVLTRTHCPHGHPYDEANTYYRRDKPGRQCRACGRAVTARRRRERKSHEYRPQGDPG